MVLPVGNHLMNLPHNPVSGGLLLITALAVNVLSRLPSASACPAYDNCIRNCARTWPSGGTGYLACKDYCRQAFGGKIR